MDRNEHQQHNMQIPFIPIQTDHVIDQIPTTLGVHYGIHYCTHYGYLYGPLYGPIM